MKKKFGLKIAGRIYSIILVSILVSSFTAYKMYEFLVENIYEMREAHLRDVVDVVSSQLAALDEQVKAGTLTLEEAQAEGVRIINRSSYDNGNYLFAWNYKNVLVAHGRSPETIGLDRSDRVDPNGVYIYADLTKVALEDGGGVVFYSTTRTAEADAEQIPKMSYGLDFKPWEWILATGTYIEDLEAQIARIEKMAMWTLGAGLLLLIVVSWLIARSVTSPIKKLNLRMHQLSDGDLHSPVPCVNKRDEVGQMARSVQVFQQDLERTAALEEQAAASQAEREADAEAQKQVVSSLAKGLTALSSGNLDVSIDTVFPEAYESLRRDFNDTVASLASVIGTISAASDRIRAQGETIGNSAENVAIRSERNAATLEQTAAAVEEITSSVQLSADSAAEVEVIVKDSSANAQLSGQIVQSVILSMQEIEESSVKISRIVGVIDGIAFQTNILALNAGIEAARAGPAGRGFAVVAAEVRELAQMSASAAAEITGLINDSSQQVNNGVKLVGRTGESLNAIFTSVTEIASRVSGIASSAREQSIGIAEINTAVSHLDADTQANAALFQETLDASQNLTEEAANLRQAVGVFNLGTTARKGWSEDTYDDPHASTSLAG
ncbi:hypothetical protein P775_11780 [Puniceibacterium antarcticum]|uniref:Methyl-accepting chemotaxis protein n=1 Tax=Puniceibacterium antarcticum TaxID=1206336 RepID=A0A2G8RF07_9RHOB|nr:methyl-accepting chemotaxis protein [Puniceibacterium antarcticum]PIL19981.1 hypothetical protein P775_11780 [Puniceibacterium antarcticum]